MTTTALNFKSIHQFFNPKSYIFVFTTLRLMVTLFNKTRFCSSTRWFNKYETIAHIFLNFCRRTKRKIRRESPLNSLQNGYIQDSRKCILSSHMSDEQTTPNSLRSAARTFPSAPPSVGSRRGRSRRCSCGSTPSQQTSRLRRPRTVSHTDGPSWGRRGGSRWAPGPGCTAAVASPTSPASRISISRTVARDV